MKHHTIVCGTSKSMPGNECYIKAKEKFYGTLHDAGIITEEEYKSAPLDCEVLAERYGICVTDIVDKTKKKNTKRQRHPKRRLRRGVKVTGQID